MTNWARDPANGINGASGGANLRRFQLTEDLYPGVASAAAKVMSWGYQTNPDGGLDAKTTTCQIYDPTKKKVVLKNTFIWAMRRPDALDANGVAGRWEFLTSEGGQWHLGKTNATIDVDGSGACTIWRTDDSGSETATTITVTAYGWGGQSIAANTKVFLFQHQKGIWYALVESGNQLVLFTLTSALAVNSSAPAVIRQWTGTAWADTGAAITVYDSSQLGPASNGTHGVAWLNPDSNRYEIVALPGNQPAFVLFHLLADIPMFGSASAQPRSWDPGSGSWIDAAGDPITVWDSSGLGMSKEGDFGIAWLNPSSGRYEIVSEQLDIFVQFELYDTTLAKGMTANASLVNFDGVNWTSTGTPDIVVNDAMLKLGPATKPARGLALHLNVAGFCNGYYVMTLDEDKTALLKRFYLNENLNQGASASAQNMTWSGALWLPDGGTPITVFDANRLGPAPYAHQGWYVTSSNGHNEIVTLDGSGHLLGRNDGDASIPQNGLGTITVYFGAAGAEAPIGVTVMACAKFGIVRPGDWVWLNWNADGWYVMPGGAGQQLLRFSTNAELTQGGTVEAQGMEWSGTNWVPDANPPITLFDENLLGPARADQEGWYVVSSNGHAEIVLLDGSGHLLAKVGDENIRVGTSGSVHVYFGTPGAEDDSGISVTAFARFSSVEAGAWVWLNWNGDGWYIVSTVAPNILYFKLTGRLAEGGSAAALEMEWDATSGTWEPGNPITVYDDWNQGPAPMDIFGIAIGDPASGRNEIAVLYLERLRMVKLTSPLERDGTASGWLQEYDEATQLWVGIDPVIVFDAASMGPAIENSIVWVSYSYMSNGYEVVSVPPPPARWAIAIENWTNLQDNQSYVTCNLAVDADGTPLEDDNGNPIEVQVTLPRAGAGDPNVREEDVLGIDWLPGPLGIGLIPVAVTGYMDDKIGTVKMWCGDENDDIFNRGWRIYGPSPAAFPVGVTTSDSDIPATAPGVTGGQKKHFHDYRTPGLRTDPADVPLDPHSGYETSFTQIDVLSHEGYETYPAYLSISIGDGNITINAGNTGNPTTNPSIAITGNANTHSPSGTGTVNTGVTVVTIPIHVPAVPFFITGGAGGPYYGLGSVSGSSFDTTENDGGHSHTIPMGSVAAALTYTTNDFASDLSATLPNHVHSIPALTGNLSAVSAEIVPNPHNHLIPSMTHIVDPPSHNHGIPAMSHSPGTHDHALPNSPQALHIPPFFGIYFIERFE